MSTCTLHRYPYIVPIVEYGTMVTTIGKQFENKSKIGQRKENRDIISNVQPTIRPVGSCQLQPYPSMHPASAGRSLVSSHRA